MEVDDDDDLDVHEELHEELREDVPVVDERSKNYFCRN